MTERKSHDECSITLYIFQREQESSILKPVSIQFSATQYYPGMKRHFEFNIYRASSNVASPSFGYTLTKLPE